MSCRFKQFLITVAIGVIVYATPSATRTDEPGAPKAIEGSGQPPKPDVPTVVKLTLHPARPPAAALEYPLLPRFVDQYPGNAATLYIKVTTLMAARQDPQEFWEKVDRWCEMPLDKLPRGEIQGRLAQYRNHSRHGPDGVSPRAMRLGPAGA